LAGDEKMAKKIVTRKTRKKIEMENVANFIGSIDINDGRILA